MAAEEIKKRKSVSSSSEEVAPPTKKVKKDKKKKEKKEKKEKKDKKKKAVEEDAAAAAKDEVEEERSEDDVVVEELSDTDYLASHSIVVDGALKSVSPMSSFSMSPFCREAQDRLISAGYTSPTATQAVSWPLALSGRDLISVAKTGSGKTLGFLLPALHKMQQKEKPIVRGPCAPQIVVLAPTRELATQIGEEASKFAPCFEARSATVYGGAPKWEQVRLLKTLGGRGLLVGTPGRVNDFLEGYKMTLSAVETFVLDEADRMLDMGFEPQIRSIVTHLPSKPIQTMLFTATWDARVQKTAAFLTKNEIVRVVFGDAASGKLVANTDIEQTVELVKHPEKRDKAVAYLKRILPAAKVIVFVGTKRGCDQLCRDIRAQLPACRCDALHGDREQYDRNRIIESFRASRLAVLVATDVAARGLDVSDVTHVLQMDFPGGHNGVADYVHRVGRTGRAGNKGLAHAFVTDQDGPNMPTLLQILNDAKQNVPPEIELLAKRNQRRGGGRGGGRFGSRNGGRGGRGGGRGGTNYGRSSYSPSNSRNSANKSFAQPTGKKVRFD